MPIWPVPGFEATTEEYRRSFLRRRRQLVALGLGLAIGVTIGLYVHRWWGSGLFRPSSVIMALALCFIGVVVMVAVARAATTHDGPATVSATLAIALVMGTVAGATIGPGYQSRAQFEGTIAVHVTSPVIADWSGGGYCWSDENSSEVGGLWVMTWIGPGAPTDGRLGFIIGSGAPTFRFGTELDDYDFFGRSRPRVEVLEIAPSRLAGDVAFSGLAPSRSGLLQAFPGQPLDGHVSWSCDPTRPTHY